MPEQPGLPWSVNTMQQMIASSKAEVGKRQEGAKSGRSKRISIGESLMDDVG